MEWSTAYVSGVAEGHFLDWSRFFFWQKAISLLVVLLLHFVWKVTPVLGTQPFSLQELKYSHHSGSQRASCWSSTSVSYNIRHTCSLTPQFYTFINTVGGRVRVAVIAIQISDTSQRLMDKLNNPSSWCQLVIDQLINPFHMAMQNAKQYKASSDFNSYYLFIFTVFWGGLPWKVLSIINN